MPGGHGPGGTCWGDRAAEGGWRAGRAERGVHAARGGGRRRRVARGRLGGPRGQGRGGVATGRRPYPAFPPLPCPPKAEGKTREPTPRSRVARPRASRPKRCRCPRHCAASSSPGPQSSRVSGKSAQAPFPEPRVGAQARGGPGLPPERWVLDPPFPDPQKGKGSRAAVAPRRPSCSPVLARRQGTESRGRRWALLKPAGPRQRHLASACSLARGPLRSRGARAPPHCALHGQPAGAHSPGPAPDPSPGAVRAHSACSSQGAAPAAPAASQDMPGTGNSDHAKTAPAPQITL